jgi:hypothetical protein
MNEFTLFSSGECRLKAEAKLALADRGGDARQGHLTDAAAWSWLADQLDLCAIEARGRMH